MNKKITIISIFGAMVFITAMVIIINGLYQNRKLFQAVEKNNYNDACEAINRGAWINTRKYLINLKTLIPTNPTPLIVACDIGNEQMVEMLLKNGADINKKDNFTDNTPLLASLYGCKSNRYSLARYLIENGADIHCQQVGVDSTFYRALYIGEDDDEETIYEGMLLLEYLLENNVDRTIFMSQENPLTHAAHYRNWAAIEYMVKNGYYKVDEYDIAGDTALIVAAKYNNMKVVDTLIKLGANKGLKDSNNKTALDYAKENGNDEIMMLLSEE